MFCFSWLRGMRSDLSSSTREGKVLTIGPPGSPYWVVFFFFFLIRESHDSWNWLSETFCWWRVLLFCIWAVVDHVSLSFVYIVLTLPFMLVSSCYSAMFDLSWRSVSLCTSLFTSCFSMRTPWWPRSLWSLHSYPHYLVAIFYLGFCPLIALSMQIFYSVGKILNFKWTVRVFCTFVFTVASLVAQMV